MNQTCVVEILDRLRPHVNIHGTPRREMFYPAFYLRGTTGLVGTIVRGLAFGTNQQSSAFRTFRNETHLFALHKATCFDIHTYYFRNDFPAFLYKYLVADMQIQPFDNIRVMERCPFDYGTRQQHRLEIRHRRDSSRAPYLERDGVQPRPLPLCLELVSDCPAGILRRKA